jgi:hypothetical protein
MAISPDRNPTRSVEQWLVAGKYLLPPILSLLCPNNLACYNQLVTSSNTIGQTTRGYEN